MRIRRSKFLIATLIATILLLAFVGAAMADAGSGSSTANGEASATDTKKPVDTDTKPPTDPVAPPKTDPPTTTPVTEEPTTTPDCDDTSTCTPTTPSEPELPTEDTCVDTPTAPECVPTTADRTPVPDAPGGGDLPFTGPGDVALAIVLALLAGSGGILFLFGASGREQLDGLNRRSMDSPSGFHVAYRELRKQQLDR